MEKDKNIYESMAPCRCFSSFKDQEIDFLSAGGGSANGGKEFKYWFLGLNWEQGFLGRTILFLKAHKTDEMELTEEEVLEKHEIYCMWRKAISQAFAPDKINQAQLGNEEHIHKGHLHWHFVPRYRRPVTFAGVEFQHDTPETQKLNYSRIAKRGICPKEIRQKIKEEILKYL